MSRPLATCRCANRLLIFAALCILTLAASGAAADRLIGVWRLNGSGRDDSQNGLHATPHRVAWTSPSSAEFDGRSTWLEVPPSPALRLRASDFTVSLWLRLDKMLDDAPGDLVTLFDPATRSGFNLTIQHQSGTCS